MALPAPHPTNPQPGTLVRLTFYPHRTYRHYVRFVEHRELEVQSVSTDAEGRLYVVAVYDGMKSTIFAEAAGRFPQFKLAVDPTQSLDWRTGYYDALEFIPADRRYMKPSGIYAAGYARGVEDRVRLGLTQSFQSLVLETDRPTLRAPSSR
jgi:hypothetical protein